MTRLKCVNCEKPAVWHMGPKEYGILLCLDHAKIAQDIQSQQNEICERQINMLEGHMYDIVGLPRPTLAYPERKAPVVIHQPKIDNSIHIDRSVVGSVNTGTIQNLEVSMSHINSSNPELAQSFKSFKEAVAKEQGLKPEQKEEILEQLSALSQEMELPQEKRRPGIIKSLIGGIKTGVGALVTLDGLWSISERLIRLYLGL